MSPFNQASPIFLQSVRMTQRDWRAGELRFLLIALALAVAALSAVGFFVERLNAALSRDAAQLFLFRQISLQHYV
jgi:putative ABC transport system permease protein